MKKKIRIQMMGIAAAAIALTTFFVVLVFYEIFEKQVLEDMRINARLLLAKDVSYKESLEQYQILNEDLRITLIDKEGEVIYDSRVRNEDMDNHRERPEFIEALKKGESEMIRQSHTIRENSFYYALKLENGNVLRLSREADSALSILFTVLPVIGGIVLCLCLLCAALSRVLTDSLMRPVLLLAKEPKQPESGAVYEELKPFVGLIKKQHEDILKNVTIRQEFTANVSHELKTPLTAISGYSELIENGMAREEDVKRFAGEIHHSANRLLTLINDTIRLSELDSLETSKSRETEKVDLYEVAKNCVSMLQISAANHQVSIFAEGASVWVEGDKQMMEELVYNLCDNAIRYNDPDGKVWITAGEREKEIYIKVKDTGIGIAKEHQERIFERFYRVDKSRSKSTGGTGLGLAIVKHIVASCGARVILDSEPGKGTEITVFFPKKH